MKEYINKLYKGSKETYFKEMDLKIPSWYNSKEDLCMQDFLNFLLKQL